ncbi:MAG TPA: hypothetical protein VG737_05250 [Cyclobacteriaceae bacterium]|nr:hypothetical protein [Cyclobacteriaceae bacterium]
MSDKKTKGVEYLFFGLSLLSMKFTANKLSLLQKEIARLLAGVKSGEISKAEAADKISHAKEQIDVILAHLQGRGPRHSK